MGLKGKLISSVEVKCGGHLVHDIFHAKTHHISNISPSKVKIFEIHEGETVRPRSVLVVRGSPLQPLPSQLRKLVKSRLTDRPTVRRSDHGPWSVSVDQDLLYPASDMNYG
ncbi:hypothetical protein MTR67_016280 [Solanum verrucosum]|uniref:Uncharacterized protein n=1 Tax=Solanum verrucosum TaxID=315347 RepID=A0AAF0QIF1_SOLVR|nr:hypothetical protein MTR67_016280 [Solanum verrucosum]